MPDSTPLAAPLDAYLAEVVRTLQDAVSQGVRRLEDDPGGADRALADCGEILDSVMEGRVQDWFA